MTKILIRSGVVLTTAFALAAAAAPAHASSASIVDNVQAGASGAGGAANAQPREKRYCLADTVTGSRIPLKVCKTRKEWRAEGVEIPADR